MLRRKLTAYAIMYAAGITAGCFMWERMRVIEAACFLLTLTMAVMYTDTGECSSGSGENSIRIKRKERRQKLVLISFMLAGLLMFSIRYYAYEAAEGACIGSELPDGGAVCRISGIVRSARLKDDLLILTADCRDISGACEADAERPEQEAETRHDHRRPGRYPGRISISVKNSGEVMAHELAGASIEASGKYRRISSADNPGCFDYRLYMRGRGVCVSFRADSMEILPESGPFGWYYRAKRLLYSARERFISRFDEECAGFIRGVIFGDKSGIDEEVIDEFNANSTGHILAVSGLHVGFLYALLRLLTGKRRTLSVSLCIIAVLIIYGEMTMWSAATQRACMVMGISLMSVHLRRPFDLLTAVSLAALVILVREPYQLFDTGFLMSFLAMSGMAVLTRPLSSAAGETLGALIAIQLSMIPVTAYTFCRMNLLSIFINIPVIMLASAMVPLCILLLLPELFTGWVPGAGIYLTELFSYAIIKINHALSFGGTLSYRVAGLGCAAVVIFYAAAFGLASEWTRIRLLRKEYGRLVRTGVILLMPFIALSMCMHDRLSDDEIIFVSVGQGDCTHIRAAGHNVLIDGGGRDDFNTGERILMPYLLHSGASSLDMALVTHLHRDHYKGISELDEIFPVGAIGIPADYRGAGVNVMRSSEDEEKDRGPQEPSADRTRLIGPDSVIHLSDDVYIDVLWPVEVSDEPLAASDPNEHNSVYMIHYRGIRVMVTGDLLEEDELRMLEHYGAADPDALRCDILKVAHHGSKSSSSEAFLDAAAPSVAVIQVGENNFYGHPHQQTLDRLEARGISVYRTDLNGAVGIDIRGKKIITDVYRPSYS